MVRLSKKKILIKLKNQKIAQNRKQAGTIRISNDAFRCHRVRKTNLTLWLDIDRTLVLATGGKFREQDMWIVERPGLKDFLKFCYHFAQSVNFFSADRYSRTLIKTCQMGVSSVSKILTYEDLDHERVKEDPSYVLICKYEHLIHVKKIPDFDPERTIIVDDIADYYLNSQRGNVIQISKFDGNMNDEGLIELTNLLKAIAGQRETTIKDAIEAAENKNPKVFVPKSVRIRDIMTDFHSINAQDV